MGLLVTLSSMTGFARAQGALGAWRWTVEIKCVNAKGLDLRLRVPTGFDRIEAPARARLGKALAAGRCSPTSPQRARAPASRRGSTPPCSPRLAAAAREAAERFGLAPPTLDGLLAVRGVVEAVETEDDEAAKAATAEAMLASARRGDRRGDRRRAAPRARRCAGCWPSGSTPSPR